MWRRYRSCPLPSLADGFALDRDDEAEWIRGHWEGVFGAQEGQVEENELLNFVVELPSVELEVSEAHAADFIK
eukprot:1565084-Amphidinium_carterae.1